MNEFSKLKKITIKVFTNWNLLDNSKSIKNNKIKHLSIINNSFNN